MFPFIDNIRNIFSLNNGGTQENLDSQKKDQGSGNPPYNNQIECVNENFTQKFTEISFSNEQTKDSDLNSMAQGQGNGNPPYDDLIARADPASISEAMFSFTAKVIGPDIVVEIRPSEKFLRQNKDFIKDHSDYFYSNLEQNLIVRISNSDTACSPAFVTSFFAECQKNALVISLIYRTKTEKEATTLSTDIIGVYKPGTTVKEIYEYAKDSESGDGKLSRTFPGHMVDLHRSEFNFTKKAREILDLLGLSIGHNRLR